MKSLLFLTIFLSLCASFVQSQYALIGGNNANIQWRNIGGVQVPNRVSATLTPANTGHGRTSFGNSQAVQNRMNEMNRRPRDEKGHIIASQFGGPAQTWNLFPQSRNMNRNVGDRPILISWYELENKIGDFLRGGGNRQVQYEIQFDYNNNWEQARPSHVTVIAHFFENGRNVDEYNLFRLRNEESPNIGVPRPG